MKCEYPVAKAGIVLAALLLVTLGACSQYGVALPNALQQPVVVLEIHDNINSVRDKLLKNLKERGRVERVIADTKDGMNQVSIVQPWIRDSSLRYYMLEFDTRTRHLSEWKAQWTLDAVASNKTLVRMRILEVLYMGPPRRAGYRPEVPVEGTGAKRIDWYETDEDTLRAAAELRHFYTQNYPLQPLPPHLAQLPIVSLDSLTNAQARLERHWRVVDRPKGF